MTEDLYNILKVQKGCSVDELKKSYKKLCIQHHPDKGGDENEFKRISEAYNILKDPEKRKLYDQFGLEGLQNGGMPDMQSMMENLFSRKQSSVNKTVVLELSLDDVVNGNPQYVYKIQRKILDPSKTKKPCNVCCGKGYRLMNTQMGFMNMQQKVKCPQCHGACYENIQELIKIVHEDVILHIPHNCPENHQFILKNRMDERPDGVAGDIILIVRYLSHPIFYRLGDDLLYTLKLSFNESLFGFHKTITLLDKSEIEISSPDIIKWNEMLVLPGRGLYNHSKTSYSNLYISFDIDYPSSITSITEPQNRVQVYHPPDMKKQIADPSFYVSHLSSKSQSPPQSHGFPGGNQAMECNQQ
jgi:DnaJ homolog subfamily A member 2